MNMKSITHSIESTPASSWMSRLGLTGFSFFFIKGLLWLLIPLLAHTALFGQG